MLKWIQYTLLSGTLVIILGSCSDRSPVVLREDGPAPPLPDLTVPSDLPAPAPDQPPPCSPPGYAQGLVQRQDKASDWTVVLPPGTVYTPLTITAARTKQGAAAFGYNRGTVQAAGFAVSLSSKASDVAHEAASAIKLITARYLDTTTDKEGSRGKSPGGHPTMALTTLTVKVPAAVNIGAARNELLAALLSVPLASISGLPSSSGSSSLSFTVRLTTVLRGNGRVLFMGAVTAQSDDIDLSKKTHIISEEIGGGTGLASHGHGLIKTCEPRLVNKPPTARVDFIWVVKEQITRPNVNKRIAQQAHTFFALAAQSGLDFRMGVTGTCRPGGMYGIAVGKFCSTASNNGFDMGGIDRFLGFAEATTFSACMKNPPGQDYGYEHGLLNVEHAIKKHLPRADDKPDKIRTGAKVVVIVIADGIPFSQRKTVTDQHQTTCTLPSKIQSAVDANLKRTLDYFKGVKDPETKLDAFYGLAGTCNNSCKATVAHGYKEAAAALNGAIYDLCAKDLSSHIKKIIKMVNEGTEAILLKHTPVAASLRVARDGVAIQRSLTNGFRYLHATNSLLFSGNQSWPKGTTLTLSYSRWK